MKCFFFVFFYSWKYLKQRKIMEQYIAAVKQNKKINYIVPEHWPETEAFFIVYYPCMCGREVVIVPVTSSRWLTRGLRDLSDPNEQHRAYAILNRPNQDHCYPHPHNNFFIDGRWSYYQNPQTDESDDQGKHGGEEEEEEKWGGYKNGDSCAQRYGGDCVIDIE